MENLAPIVAVLALIAWTWACQRLQRAAQPLRLELAEKGERLLGDSDLPVEVREFVRLLLDTAFSNRVALIFGIFAVPAIAVCIAVVPNFVTKRVSRLAIPDAATRAAFEEVMRLHDRITLANHPILLILVEFEILLFVPVSILASGLIRGLVPEKVNRDATMDILESAGGKFRDFQLRMLKAS